MLLADVGGNVNITECLEFDQRLAGGEGIVATLRQLDRYVLLAQVAHGVDRVDQQMGVKFDGNAYLYIFNEARDIVACVKLPKELPIVETKTEN